MTVAVVTGGSAGFGRAVVRELATRGFDVAVLARGEEGVAGAVADVRATGRRALGVSVDVADRLALEAAADRVEAELGPIDVWVNNAMATVFAPFMETAPEEFERAVQVTFFGFVNGTRAALSRMRPRNSGTVVQVGSALAHRGIPLQSAYCASKAAMTRFTESVVTELLHDRSAVTISQVDLPGMNTPQFDWTLSRLPDHAQPVPPIYQPELCATVVADVAQKPRRRTWVGEPTVFTILGNRFGSRFADASLARSGYKGQVDPSLPAPTLGANLFAPRPGDQGARGSFDDRALSRSPQIWAVRHRPQTVAIGLGALGALAAALPSIARRLRA